MSVKWVFVSKLKGGVHVQHSFELLKIIEFALKKDTNKIVGYATMLQNKLENEGNNKLAVKIEKLLNSNTVGTIEAKSSNSLNLPFDQESNMQIGEFYNPDGQLEKVVLNKELHENIEKFLKYYEKRESLYLEGINHPNTILMYGPPGCGKTLLAKTLSQKLDLPMVIIRLDSIISSFLGSTAKNIRKIFDYAKNNPCILFFDEFDAIAKVRDDQHELGELKRVVNSLLQNIDMLNNDSILIAASNHEHLLDPALWRRFQLKLEIGKPDFNSRVTIIENNLSQLNKSEVEILAYIFQGLSPAAINNICTYVKRDSIVFDNDVNLTDIITVFFSSSLTTDHDNNVATQNFTFEDKVLYIREINSKFFTYELLGEIFQISKSKVARILNRKE